MIVTIGLSTESQAQESISFPLVPEGTQVLCPKPPPCDPPVWSEELQEYISGLPEGCGITGEMEVKVEALPWQQVVGDTGEATAHAVSVYLRCLNCRIPEEPSPDPSGLSLVASARPGAECVAGPVVPILLPEGKQAHMWVFGALLVAILRRRRTHAQNALRA